MPGSFLAFSNPQFYNTVKSSKYFHPVVFTPFKHNSDETELIGLRTGKLFFSWSVFNQIPEFIDIDYLKKINNILKKDTYIEFRNVDGFNINKKIFERFGYIIIDWYNIIVDINLKEKLWRNLNESKRRQVRKSYTNGAVISIAENIEDVKSFYNILKILYSKRVKKPLPDWNFFKAFYYENQDKKFGIYILVKHKGKVIAGMMCPVTPNETLYEWYVAGLDKEYNPLGIYPSVLVTWGALKYAFENNFHRFNFMGAGQPDKPYGVRDFKMQFGGRLVNSGRFVKVNKPFLYWLGKMYFRIREGF